MRAIGLSHVSVCVRVALGPQGLLYGDALPAGLCTYCKKQLFESCCFGFCFLSQSHLPTPMPQSHFTQLGRRCSLVWAPVQVLAVQWHHFSSTLCCFCKETALSGSPRSLGTRVGK